jgi:hypothetical protein
MLAGLRTRRERAKQVGELALCELGTDVGAVAGLLEQMRVRVEGHARPGVAEDPADLGDVEADVDDQMAREGVAQIVEAHPPTVPIQTRVDGGPTPYPLRDVVVQERRATRGGEHVIGALVRRELRLCCRRRSLPEIEPEHERAGHDVPVALPALSPPGRRRRRRRRQCARPIPELPPVTTATLSTRRIASSLFRRVYGLCSSSQARLKAARARRASTRSPRLRGRPGTPARPRARAAPPPPREPATLRGREPLRNRAGDHHRGRSKRARS